MTLVPTRNGASYYMNDAGNYWRTYVFIERVKSSHVAEKPEQAEQVGRAFSYFKNDSPTCRRSESRKPFPQFTTVFYESTH